MNSVRNLAESPTIRLMIPHYRGDHLSEHSGMNAVALMEQTRQKLGTVSFIAETTYTWKAVMWGICLSFRGMPAL